MANAPKHKVPLKAFIRRALESARKDIEQIERRFHRTISSAQTTTARRARTAAARTRIASGSSTGRAAPAITKVLHKRRRGLTMERLQEALPQFDQKSLFNATFAMRRKGLITFEKSGKGRGSYRWQEQV